VRGIVRLSGFPVRAKIRHDHPEAVFRDPLGMPELDPVHLRIGEEAVQQDHRLALAQLMIGKLDTVRRGPEMGGWFRHSGIFPVAFTHLLTSA
jgi:hypothetical protein